MKLPNNYLLCNSTGVSVLTFVQAADNLSQVFANPPPAAHPHTWWHWNNGNVNKEGITLDLEAMKRIGITGAQIFNVKRAPPTARCNRRPRMDGTDQVCGPGGGPARDGSHHPQLPRLERVRRTMDQARALDAESRLGGKQRHRRARLTSPLPQPETILDHYRDIALFAFPTEPAESNLLACARTIAVDGTRMLPPRSDQRANSPAKLIFAATKSSVSSRSICESREGFVRLAEGDDGSNQSDGRA